MDPFMQPKHPECTVNCKNLYQCLFTCHECSWRLPNSNRCSEHNYSHEDPVLLRCAECLHTLNRNTKCLRHRLRLGQIDLNPGGENCDECKKLSDTSQFHTLRFCERCGEEN